MDTAAPMPAGADWQDHVATTEPTMGTSTTRHGPHDPTAAKKQRPPVMVLTGSYSTPVIVGRGSQATLNLGRINKQVSRRHAIIEWHPPTSQFRISVLGQNGVRINGVGFPSGQQCPLKRGDVVDLVGVKMVFKTPSTPPPPRSPLPQSLSSAAHQAFIHHAHVDQEEQDSEEQDENLDYALSPMTTPIKKPLYTQTGTALLQSPASSPARFSDPLMPSSPVAARMRQKMLKYESRAPDSHHQQQQHHHLQSPPPSDPPTDPSFFPSPVKSRPLFDLAREAERMQPLPLRPRLHHQHPTSLDDNVFLVGPTTATPDTTRAPLSALAIDAPSTTNNTRHHDTLLPTLARTESASGLKVVQKDKEEIKKDEDVKEVKSKQSKALVADSVERHVSPVTVKVATTQQQQQQQKHHEEETRDPLTKDLDKKGFSSHREENEDPAKAQKDKKKKEVSIKPSTHSAEAASSKSERESEKMDTKTLSTETKEKKKIKKKQDALDQVDKKKNKAKKQEPAEEEEDKKKKKKKQQQQAKEEEAAAEGTSKAKEGQVSERKEDKPKTDYTEMIIDTLVFARKKKSMTLSELYDEIMVSQPSLVKTQEPEAFKEELLRCLSGAKCVGKITRKGKDAYNKPLESQWYYIPEQDHNVMRKLTRQEVMPSARKCTLKDKQYFFKMPPKLPYHRKSTSPYAVKPSRVKDVRLELTDDADADNRSSSSSSSSESEADDEPLAVMKKASVEKRKRMETLKEGQEEEEAEREDEEEEVEVERRRGMGGVNENKKRRTDGVAGPSFSRSQKQDEEEESDESEDDVPDQDSLDDLSELSGLEDHDH